MLPTKRSFVLLIRQYNVFIIYYSSYNEHHFMHLNNTHTGVNNNFVNYIITN